MIIMIIPFRFYFHKVTIEELESKFVPCDITPDMYDTDVDDYTLFLAETFGQPVVADDLAEDVEIEAEQDPDFVYQVRPNGPICPH